MNQNRIRFQSVLVLLQTGAAWCDLYENKWTSKTLKILCADYHFLLGLSTVDHCSTHRKLSWG